MVIYFSGTGNSAYCANKIATAINDETANASEYIKKNETGNFTSNKPWIFVCPTYAWQVPHIFEAFIKNSTFTGSDDAYFIMTCGDDTGAAGVHNKNICKEKAFNYKGTLPVVMPENYIAMFGVPDEEESRRIISEAVPVIKKAADIITRGESFPQTKGNIVDKTKSGIVNRAFYALCVSGKAFYVKESCIACGKCERLCVTNCISLKEGKPVWGKGCTHCMACISFCPEQAIEYGKKSVGQRRYQCVSD